MKLCYAIQPIFSGGGILTLLVLLFSTLSAPAQTQNTATVTGCVVTASAEPVVGAVVICSRGGEVAAAATSDIEGRFSLKLAATDSLTLKITHLQHEPYAAPLISDDVGTITLADKSYNVDEVVVKGDYMKRRGTEMLVTVTNNPDAKGRNALEFMNTLPGMNGLSIHGKGISKVYVNNREMKLPPDLLYRYVASLRAEDVESMRIIPQRGARYEAGHSAGVIRLRLKRGSEKNFSGNISVPVTVKTHDGALSTHIPVSLNYMKGKISSHTFLYGSWMQNEHTRHEYTIGDTVEENVNDRTFYAVTFDQSVVWDVADNHAVGAAVNGFLKPRETNTTTSAVSLFDDRTELYEGGATLTYDWSIGERGSSVAFAGDYLLRRDGYSSNYLPLAAAPEYTASTIDKRTFSLTLDGEYVMPNELSTLSFGAFYIDMCADEDIEQFATESDFGYNERIYGAYAEFYTPLFDETLDLTVGLRYEGAAVDWDYFTPDADPRRGDDRFSDLFPSASLTWNHGDGTSYTSLDYERVIFRPLMSEYDPTLYRESDNVFYVGTTHLRPMFENILSLTQTIKRNHTLRLSYTWQNDYIDTSYEQRGDQIFEMVDNTASIHRVELYADTRFWIVKKKLSAGLNATLSYERHRHDTYGRSDNWMALFSGWLSWRLPKQWKIVGNGFYITPSTTATYRSAARWNLRATLSKQFNDRLSLSLNANQILGNRTVETRSMQPDVTYNSLKHTYFSGITLELGYNFGSKKLQYVKQARANSEAKARVGGR